VERSRERKSEIHWNNRRSGIRILESQQYLRRKQRRHRSGRKPGAVRSLLRQRSINDPHDSSKTTVSTRLDHRVRWISGVRVVEQRQETQQLCLLGRSTGDRSWRQGTTPSSGLPCRSALWNSAVFDVHHRKRADLSRLLQVME